MTFVHPAQNHIGTPNSGGSAPAGSLSGVSRFGGIHPFGDGRAHREASFVKQESSFDSPLRNPFLATLSPQMVPHPASTRRIGESRAPQAATGPTVLGFGRALVPPSHHCPLPTTNLAL